MTQADPVIDLDRLRATLDAVNGFGADVETGGFNRIGFSDADLAARRWFAEEMRRDGLSVRMDAVGNLFGGFGPADGLCVMIGSHLDTVPNAGAFGGALGVCVGLECVRALKAAGATQRLAVEVVATSDEEGRFGGMLGSQAIAGQVAPVWIEAAVDADGVRTARAKGLPRTLVLYRHALRSGLVPIVAMLGMQFAYLMGGAIVVENVFAWNGVGRLAAGATPEAAVARRDDRGQILHEDPLTGLRVGALHNSIFPASALAQLAVAARRGA